ncbi:MAG: DUF4921 family protein [Chloroflexi bacterium]|nr:DUF4921 family protein [Chloroflexota bacterium]
MPQLRQDLVTGRWVTIATERARRPSSFSRAPAVAVSPAATCPFCVGHEDMTPPEVLADRAPGTLPNAPGWEIRVVPNLYPAFGPPDREPVQARVGPYETMDGVGVHEVLISSPSHTDDFAQLPVEHIARIVRASIARYTAHAANPAIEYLLLINNHGKEAGASLEHPHSQLFGIPFVPPVVQEELEGSRRYRAAHRACVFCDMIAWEEQSGERVILTTDHFIAFAPFAARTPFESWIVPRRHAARFEMMSGPEQEDFARALHELIARLVAGLNDPPYNFYIHTAPVHSSPETDYHWHLELLPKLTIAAGFELGTGVMINVVTPESSAEFLRGVDLSAPGLTAATPTPH